MYSIYRKIQIQYFLENSTIHGVSYLKTSERRQKCVWSITITVASLLIILATIFMIFKYQTYDSYIIIENVEIEKFDSLPNIIFCATNGLQLLKSMISVNLINQKTIDEIRSNFSLRNQTSSEKFSLNSINKSKQKFLNDSKMFFLECQVTLHDQVFSCRDIVDVLYTFSGPCHLISLNKLNIPLYLLDKPKILVPYTEKSRVVSISLVVNKKYRRDNHFYFMHDSIDTLKYPIYSSESNHMQLDRQNTYRYDFNVVILKEKFSKTLENIKCNERTDATQCHYECLQLIIKQVLNCTFTLLTEFQDDEQQFLCTVNDLVVIEEIIKNYTKQRGNICNKACLPICESIGYLIEPTLVEISRFNNWTFILEYQVAKRTHMISLEYVELLNFINGLWSLLLGISVLSLWEIMDLISSFIVYKVPLLQKINRKKFSINSRVKIFFHDTVLHGFKHVFNKTASNFRILQWMFAIMLATLMFIVYTKDLIQEYREYTTDFRISEVANDMNNNNFTIITCARLPVQNTYFNIYNSLTVFAEEMLLSSKHVNFDETIKAYRSYYLMQNKNNMTERMNNLNDFQAATKAYGNIFNQIDFGYDYLNVTHKIIFDQYCVIHRKLSNNQLTGTNYRILNASGKLIDTSKKAIMCAVDSTSFHVSYKSCLYYYEYEKRHVQAKLVSYEYLNEPYQPYCESKSDNIKHDCEISCINSFVLKTFGCMLLAYNYETKDNYCHPMMIPLIKVYYQNNGDCDKMCRASCHLLLYELEPTSVNYKIGSKSKIVFSNTIEHRKQVETLSLKNVFIIILSYLSLFYGASLLALFQLNFNAVNNIVHSFKRQPKVPKFCEPLMNFLSKLTTLHCFTYLSAKETSSFKRLVWLMLISIAISVVTIYLFTEINTFSNNAKKVSRISEADRYSDNILLPKIDICQKLAYGSFTNFRYLNESDRLFTNYLNSLKQFIRELDKDLDFNASLEKYVQNIYKNYTERIISEEQQQFSDIKWSNRIHLWLNRLSLFALNKIDWNAKWWNFLNLKNSTRLKIYFQNDLRLIMCYELDWSLFRPNATTSFEFDISSPFVKLERNQLMLHLRSHREYYLFYENYPLSNMMIDHDEDEYSYNGVWDSMHGNEFTEHGFHARILGYFDSFNFKSVCNSNKDKCVYYKDILYNYTDYALLKCNNSLKNLIYETFNCTPFFNKKEETREECSIVMMQLIMHIMNNFGKTNCEISHKQSPLEYIESDTKEIENDRYAIDFNNAKLYHEEIVEEYDLLKLIINLSNFLNVTIGFSFITLLELFYFIFIHFFKYEKLVPT